MSLPSVSEVRNRIDAIEDISIKRLFQTVYLFGLRIGEACGHIYPSEIGKAQPTGMLLWASQETWELQDEDDDETITLLKRIMMRNYGKELSDNDILQLRELAFVLSIITEKRQGFNRQVAIPDSAEYEPWAKEVREYIQHRQGLGPLPHLRKLTEEMSMLSPKPLGITEILQTKKAHAIIKKYEPVFPFRRQEIYPLAVKIFQGFTYPIVKYNRPKTQINAKGEKEIVTIINAKGEKETVYEPIPDHQKKFSDHALRHARSTELKTKCRIKGDLLNQFMGWARNRNSEASAMQDRYILEPWKEAGYFPRLLRRKS